MKFSSSSTNKGLYPCCQGCIFNVPNSNSGRSKYPCLKSHKEVRRGYLLLPLLLLGILNI